VFGGRLYGIVIANNFSVVASHTVEFINDVRDIVEHGLRTSSTVTITMIIHRRTGRSQRVTNRSTAVLRRTPRGRRHLREAATDRPTDAGDRPFVVGRTAFGARRIIRRITMRRVYIYVSAADSSTIVTVCMRAANARITPPTPSPTFAHKRGDCEHPQR